MHRERRGKSIWRQGDDEADAAAPDWSVSFPPTGTVSSATPTPIRGVLPRPPISGAQTPEAPRLPSAAPLSYTRLPDDCIQRQRRTTAPPRSHYGTGGVGGWVTEGRSRAGRAVLFCIQAAPPGPDYLLPNVRSWEAEFVTVQRGGGGEIAHDYFMNFQMSPRFRGRRRTQSGAL